MLNSEHSDENRGDCDSSLSSVRQEAVSSYQPLFNRPSEDIFSDIWDCVLSVAEDELFLEKHRLSDGDLHSENGKDNRNAVMDQLVIWHCCCTLSHEVPINARVIIIHYGIWVFPWGSHPV